MDELGVGNSGAPRVQASVCQKSVVVIWSCQLQTSISHCPGELWLVPSTAVLPCADPVLAPTRPGPVSSYLALPPQGCDAGVSWVVPGRGRFCLCVCSTLIHGSGVGTR